MFAAASYNSAFTIAETLGKLNFNILQRVLLVILIGPDAAIATSFDDKAAVHIGVTAAKRQGQMLMNMQ